MPRTSKEVCLKIIKLHHQKWSIYAISKKLGLFTSTITRIIHRYKQNWIVYLPKITLRTKKKQSENGERLLFVRQKNTIFSLQKNLEPKLVSHSTVYYLQYFIQLQLTSSSMSEKNSLWSPEIGSKDWSSAERKWLIFDGKMPSFFGWNNNET